MIEPILPPPTSPAPRPSAEERFRALFEQAPFSTQLIAPNGVTLAVNKAWEDTWDTGGEGRLKSLVVQTDYNVLTDLQLEEKGIAPLLRLAAQGQHVQLPVICYDPAESQLPGTRRWVKATAHPILGARGEVLEIMLIHEDVTATYEAESAKRAIEVRLQHGLAAAKMIVWEWDLVSHNITFSENVRDVLGAHPEKIDHFDEGVHPDDIGRLHSKRRKAIESGSDYQEVVRYARQDNAKPLWLDVRGHVQRSQDGTPINVRGVTLDVSERMTAELQLRENDRRKDEFLAMLAHELRNPLAPISTAAQLIKLSASVEQRVRSSDVIERQVAHMTDLIDDLLDVSRVTRGLVELSPEPLDLREVAHEAVEQAMPLIDARHHSLRIDLPEHAVTVSGDRPRLIQVVVNLLTNAAKYTAQEGRIGLLIECSETHVELSVADNGLGIDPNALERMFELFTQAERTPDRSQGGLGLGLPLVKSLMVLHGGSVTAESEGPGSGSTFILRLPRLQLPSALSSVQDEGRERVKHQQCSVVVVDDNVDAATTLGELLTVRGHRVRTAFDGMSALEMADDAPAQVFILDVGLPGMDGLELARRLRANPPTRDSIIIALTGYGQSHDRVLTKTAGFDAHFVKPTSVDSLEQAFLHLSDGRKNARSK